jgi:hypothetical protein
MLIEIKDYTNKYYNKHFTSRTAVVAGMVCSSACLEMAILATVNISQINSVSGFALETLKYNLSANLGGAIFYGLSAVNIIPRSAAIGAAIFSIYSVFNFEYEGAYLTSKIIGTTVKFISEKIISPICKHILAPMLRRIGEIAAELISFIGKLIVNMSLPKHPIWIGVIILGSAIIIHQLVIPRFKKNQIQNVKQTI